MLVRKKIHILLAALLIILLGGFAVFLSSCGNEAKSDGKIIVAVTIVPEETFVRAVCGDLVQIVTLVPPGGSPENYEPNPMIMENLEKADIFFTVGVPVEEANILSTIASDIKVISLEDECAKVYPERTFEEGGERDPHIWLSPRRVMIMIETIAREMSVIDPLNSETYQKNAADYLGQLEALDIYIKTKLEGIVNRTFIVYHPAFGYLADDYNLTMFALEEEGKEATAKHLTEMIDLAKAQNIKAIFYQEEIDSSQSEAFAEELGGKTIGLSPLDADYIDNLMKMVDLIAEVMK